MPGGKHELCIRERRNEARTLKKETDMKRFLGLIIALLAGLTAIRAMSYEEARDRARFLTDKMAYELNLNEQQYNDAYEINLDYLMNIRTASDASGVYLECRNADLRYILHDWQYALFQAATYFFRPILWRATGWFLPIYTIYSPTLFYYGPPRVYHVYRGGHFQYRHEHRVSFYAHRRPAWHGGLRGESRGPLPGRPAPPREPHRGNGFRFEPVGRPQRPANPAPRPNHHGGNGFKFEAIGTPPREAGHSNGTSSRPTTNRPPTNSTTRPARNTQPNARNHGRTTPATTHPTTSQRNDSRYTRKSSTRTTVNNVPKRTEMRPNTQRTTIKREARPTNRNSPNGARRGTPARQQRQAR